MIVLVKEEKSKNMWIFLKPLTTNLWLASFAFFIFTGFVVWAIEHRINQEFRGPPSHQLGTMFYFAFSTLVFGERLESNLSRFVVVEWVFVVLILNSSYTASLTSMLTLEKLKPTVADVDDLIKNGDYVGYQYGSFVKDHLLTWLRFDEKKIKAYSTPDQYNEALSNGEVAAIFDEIPYLKVFLSKYCDQYAMVGPIYKTGGFGFAFPRGSPLVPDISRAILNMTQGDEMTGIEKKWFGDQITCPGDSNKFESTRLKFLRFGGLFLITGVASSLSLLYFLATFLYKDWDELKAAASQTSFCKRLVAWYKHYDKKDLNSYTFRYKPSLTVNDRHEPAVEIVASPAGFEGLQSPFSVISNISDTNIGDTPDEVKTPGELGQPDNFIGGEPVETSTAMPHMKSGN